MPRILIAGITAVILLMVSVYQYIIEPLLRNFYNLSLIDFNILIPLTNSINNFKLMDFNYTNTFFVIVISIIILIILKLSHKYTRETMIRHGYITIPSYLLLYSFLASIDCRLNSSEYCCQMGSNLKYFLSKFQAIKPIPLYRQYQKCPATRTKHP